MIPEEKQPSDKEVSQKEAGMPAGANARQGRENKLEVAQALTLSKPAPSDILPPQTVQPTVFKYLGLERESHSKPLDSTPWPLQLMAILECKNIFSPIFIKVPLVFHGFYSV